MADPEFEVIAQQIQENISEGIELLAYEVYQTRLVTMLSKLQLEKAFQSHRSSLDVSEGYESLYAAVLARFQPSPDIIASAERCAKKALLQGTSRILP